MIQRIRRPDGTRHDIDHGPGPFGDEDIRSLYRSRYLDHQAGVLVSSPDAIQPKPLVGLFAGVKKAWRERQKEQGS